MRYLSDRGFTLLELIVVLLLIAMATTMVAGSLGKARDKAVIRQAAADVRNALRYARETSLMQRVPVALVPDEEENTYRLEKNEEPFGAVKEMPRGVEISGEAVVFMPKGDSTGGAIALTDQHQRGFVIEVDPVTGKATVGRL